VNRPVRAPPEKPKPCATAFESVALLLQGGGALGAYQAGVYEGLLEHGIEPTWIAGISIGAINSAIIAGNPVEERVAKLRAFWDLVSDASDGGVSAWWTHLFRGDSARGWINRLAAGGIIASGVRGFFSPRFPPPYLQPNGTAAATSWYDTQALKATLERLVDFDRINARSTRFSIGAVNVRTGNFAYFDNETDVIRPEHVMASGALPPAFPAVEIEGQSYWDGGMVSNTPLDWVLSARSDLDTLVLQVDLWSARGEMPRDLSEVAVRMKEIQYSSRTRAATDEFRKLQKLRATFNELFEQLPDELKATPQAKLLAEAADPSVYNIVQLVYRSPTYEGQSKDYEFSRRTMEEHWRAGHRDAVKTLSHPEVLTLPTTAHGVEVYDFTTPPAEQAPAKSPKDALG
jgi:NTE family protein